jgi:hypothetical protein
MHAEAAALPRLPDRSMSPHLAGLSATQLKLLDGAGARPGACGPAAVADEQPGPDQIRCEE